MLLDSPLDPTSRRPAEKCAASVHSPADAAHPDFGAFNADLISRCRECDGRRGFYSDSGPAPRWEVCPDCDGAGSWVRFTELRGGFVVDAPEYAEAAE